MQGGSIYILGKDNVGAQTIGEIAVGLFRIDKANNGGEQYDGEGFFRSCVKY